MEELMKNLGMLNQIPDYFLNAKNSLGFGLSIIIFFLMATYSLFSFERIEKSIELAKLFRDRKIRKINDFLENSDGSDRSVLSLLHSTRDSYYFQVATGIFAEDKLRVALIWLHQSTPSEVSWKTIKLAYPNLRANEKGQIEVIPYAWYERFLWVVTNLMCRLFFVISAAFFLLVAISFLWESKDHGNANFNSMLLRLLAYSCLFYLYGFYMAFLSRDHLATEKIRRALESIKPVQNHIEISSEAPVES